MSAQGFGEVLRRLREQAGLSQDQLAERSGLTAHGISALERGARTRPRLSTVRLLADGLGLGQNGLQKLLSSRNGDPLTHPIHRVPKPTSSFIGRTQELARIGTLLLESDVRLVTLTGPGGIGKTRIAIKLAHDHGHHFAAGAVFVSLAEVSLPEGVLPALATSLGVPMQPTVDVADVLGTALEQSKILLVLDNLEHLTDCAPAIGHLLARCPLLTVLATSRVVLRLSGEHVVRVGPMDVQGDALELFYARARAADSEFVPNQDDDAAIVRKLEGLPLGIELVAAQVHHLSRSVLLSQLDTQLPLLTNGPVDSHPRQRSIRDTIAWSYGLLSPEAQRVLRWLAAFPEGCTLEIAKALFGEREALAALAELEDSSLISQRSGVDGAMRYTMLQTVYEYAQEMLQQTGEEDVARGAIQEVWAMPLTRHAELCHRRRNAAEIMRMVHAEYANVLAHMEWLITSEHIDDAIDLSCALVSWRHSQGRFEETRREMDLLLSHPLGSPASHGRVGLLCGLGTTLSYLCESVESVALLQQAADMARELGERRYLSMSLMTQYHAYKDWGDLDRAEACVREGMLIAQNDGDIYMEGICIGYLGNLSMIRGELDIARLQCEKSMELLSMIENQRGMGDAKVRLARLSIQLGDLDAAERYALEAREHMERNNDRRDITLVYRLLAEIARRQERHENALAWLATAMEIAQEIGRVSEMAYIQLELAQMSSDGGEAHEHYRQAERWFGYYGDVNGLEACRIGMARA